MSCRFNPGVALPHTQRWNGVGFALCFVFHMRYWGLTGYIIGPLRAYLEETGWFDLFAFAHLQSWSENVRYLRSAHDVIELLLILRISGVRRDKAERWGDVKMVSTPFVSSSSIYFALGRGAANARASHNILQDSTYPLIIFHYIS